MSPEALVGLRLPNPAGDRGAFIKRPVRQLAEAASPDDLVRRMVVQFRLRHHGQVRILSRAPRGCDRPVTFAALLPCDHDELRVAIRKLPAELKGPQKNWVRMRKQAMGMAHVCMEPGCGRVFMTAMLGNLDGHVRSHREPRPLAEPAGDGPGGKA